MRTQKLTLQAVAAVFAIAVPSFALAQPGAAPPPPPANSGYQGGGGYQGYYSQPYSTRTADGFWLRQGWTFGVGLGLGGLDTDSGVLDCFECDYDPAAVGFNLHVGGMINPRLAILGEMWMQFQQIDAEGFGQGYQSMLLAAVQYWVMPQLWIKGGLGFAGLGVSYADGYADDLNSGAAVMGAVGYELYSSPEMAVDLQLRLGAGSYNSGVEDRAQTVMLSGGINWY